MWNLAKITQEQESLPFASRRFSVDLSNPIVTILPLDLIKLGNRFR